MKTAVILALAALCIAVAIGIPEKRLSHAKHAFEFLGKRASPLMKKRWAALKAKRQTEDTDPPSGQGALHKLAAAYKAGNMTSEEIKAALATLGHSGRRIRNKRFSLNAGARA